MATVQIHDFEDDGEFSCLAVDLRDVLDCLGGRALQSVWEVDGVPRDGREIMVSGEEASDRLEALARSGERIPGALLVKLANLVWQIIWGEFRAYEGDAEAPWVVVRAISSTYYEVESEDENVLAVVTTAFKDVRPPQ